MFGNGKGFELSKTLTLTGVVTLVLAITSAVAWSVNQTSQLDKRISQNRDAIKAERKLQTQINDTFRKKIQNITSQLDRIESLLKEIRLKQARRTEREASQ